MANNAKSVYALGGDDLICLTGSSFPYVEAGEGNDTVDATGAILGSRTVLGEGDDRYLGSTGYDNVSAGTRTSRRAPHEDIGHDVISTGPKGDIQDTVHSGQPGQTNADEVRGGWMELNWIGHATGTGVMDGGAHSQLRLNPTDTEGLSIYSDLGKLATRGQPLQNISGFTDFTVTAHRGLRQLWFIGGDRDEKLHITGLRKETRFQLSFGRGDDRL